MPARHLKSAEYTLQRWKNDLGWTREIRRHPRHDEDFDWRISLADIDEDCPFSSFPGYQRTLVLLKGKGLRLRFPDGREDLLNEPHERIDFSGDDALQCQLLGGPTRDFNLMWRPERVSAHLQLAHVGETDSLPPLEADQLHILHVLNGRLECDFPGIHAAATLGDTLILPAEDAPDRPILLNGPASFLRIHLAPS